MIDVPILSPELNSYYRDYPNRWEPPILEELFSIQASGCYQPRYYHAPSNDLESLAPSPGYLRYSMVIPGGSYIWAILHFETSDLFVAQVTDDSLNHKFFSSPVPNTFVRKGNNRTPWFLARPYPVVEPGIFTVEFWLTAVTTSTVSLTFGVLEVDKR